MSKRKDKISIKNGRVKITFYENDEKAKYVFSAKELVMALIETTEKNRRLKESEDE